MKNTDKIYPVLFLLLYAIIVSLFYGRHYTVLTPHLLTETDTGVYSAITNAFLSGREFYSEIWEHKGPFWPLFFAIPMLLSSSYMGVVIVWSIIQWGILVYVYKIARLFLSTQAAIFTVLITPFAILGNFAANPSELVLLFQLIFLYLFLKKYAFGKDVNLWYLGGLFSSIILFVKFNLVAFLVPLMIYDALSIVRRRGWRALPRHVAQFCSTFLGITLITFFFVSPAETWNHYVLFNLFYAGESPVLSWEILSTLVAGISFTMDIASALPVPHYIHLLVAVFFTFAWMFCYPKERGGFLFWVLLFTYLLTLVAVFSGLRGYYHYYNTIKPFYVLSFVFFLRSLSHFFSVSLLARIPVGLMALLSLITGASFVSAYTYINIKVRRTYEIEQQTVATLDYLRSITQGSKSNLLVINADAGYYHMSHQLPPTRYPFPPAIDFNKFPHYIDAWKSCVASRSCQYVLVGSIVGDHQDALSFTSRDKVVSYIKNHGYVKHDAPIAKDLQLFIRVAMDSN